MKLIKQVLHLCSYLQYPSMILALYYVAQPLFAGSEIDWPDLNSSLIFVGLGISLATLQDPSKSQNKIFKYLKDRPKEAPSIIILMASITLFIMVIGLLGFFSVQNGALHELYFGFFLLGVGLIGFLKSAVEILEL